MLIAYTCPISISPLFVIVSNYKKMFESTQQNVENQEKSDDDSQNLLGRPEPKLQFHE